MRQTKKKRAEKNFYLEIVTQYDFDMYNVYCILYANGKSSTNTV